MKNINNFDCELFDTEACGALNMRSCKSCPVPNGGDAAQIAEDVELFESLMPEGGLAPLFEPEDCQLCRGEKQKKSGYAILDMGHNEPKRLQRRSWLLPKGVAGFLVPMQFACCRACRRRLLFLSYLPLLSSILLTAIAVMLATNDAIAMSLRKMNSLLPLYLVGGAMLLGYLAGLLIAIILRKGYNRVMVVNALEHPTAIAMMEKGWFPVLGRGRAKLVFTKKRIDRGLGTAPSSEQKVTIGASGSL